MGVVNNDGMGVFRDLVAVAAGKTEVGTVKLPDQAVLLAGAAKHLSWLYELDLMLWTSAGVSKASWDLSTALVTCAPQRFRGCSKRYFASSDTAGPLPLVRPKAHAPSALLAALGEVMSTRSQQLLEGAPTTDAASQDQLVRLKVLLNATTDAGQQVVGHHDLHWLQHRAQAYAAANTAPPPTATDMNVEGPHISHNQQHHAAASAALQQCLAATHDAVPELPGFGTEPQSLLRLAAVHQHQQSFQDVASAGNEDDAAEDAYDDIDPDDVALLDGFGQADYGPHGTVTVAAGAAAGDEQKAISDSARQGLLDSAFPAGTALNTAVQRGSKYGAKRAAALKRQGYHASVHGANGSGKSNFRGVFWDRKNSRWRAQVGFNNRKIFMGYFGEPAEAARAYDKKVVQLHGALAKTNFPLEEYVDDLRAFNELHQQQAGVATFPPQPIMAAPAAPAGRKSLKRRLQPADSDCTDSTADDNGNESGSNAGASGGNGALAASCSGPECGASFSAGAGAPLGGQGTIVVSSSGTCSSHRWLNVTALHWQWRQVLEGSQGSRHGRLLAAGKQQQRKGSRELTLVMWPCSQLRGHGWDASQSSAATLVAMASDRSEVLGRAGGWGSTFGALPQGPAGGNSVMDSFHPMTALILQLHVHAASCAWVQVPGGRLRHPQNLYDGRQYDVS
eukprot:gene13081-13208_t